jgi:hypothetical protein
MAKVFRKIEPIISLSDFLKRATQVKSFTSSTGKRYKVTKIENNVMWFLRLDAKADTPWDMDLKGVYQAYVELNNYDTENFRPYVNRRHSPARGLLLHLGLLK